MYILYCTYKGNNKVENQDRYSIIDRKDYTLIIVADGLGSSRYSFRGAKLVCNIVAKYVHDSYCNGLDYLESTIDNVITIWNREVSLLGPVDDFNTTCSFILIDKNEHSYLSGKIGDSIIVTIADSKSYVQFESKDFLNETRCLGSSNLKFECHRGNYYNKICFLLATDGICDEMNTSMFNDFFTYVKSTYTLYEHKINNRLFKKDIIKSFGQLNNDDKTIVMGWNSK